MTNAPPQPAAKTVSVWVKLFVLFHVFAITVYALPNPPTAIREHRIEPGGSEWLLYWNDVYLKNSPPVALYTKTTGLWQYWDMFAPNPTHTDTWGDAEVIYRNGSVKRYAYPRIFELPLWKKFVSERYRKFFERVGNDDNPFLWPSFSLRIALINDDPKNPPVQVKLYRHVRQVAPPGQWQDPHYKSYMFYSYSVDEKELQRLRNTPL